MLGQPPPVVQPSKARQLFCCFAEPYDWYQGTPSGMPQPGVTQRFQALR